MWMIGIIVLFLVLVALVVTTYAKKISAGGGSTDPSEGKSELRGRH